MLSRSICFTGNSSENVSCCKSIQDGIAKQFRNVGVLCSIAGFTSIPNSKNNNKNLKKLLRGTLQLHNGIFTQREARKASDAKSGKSQNERIVEVGRCLWRSSPTPLLISVPYSRLHRRESRQLLISPQSL